MSDTKDKWGFVTRTGDVFSNGASAPGEDNRRQAFYKIIERVYLDHQTASSNWDQPTKLLLNGEFVELPGGVTLTDFAWVYMRTHQSEHEALSKKLQTDYYPKSLGGNNG